MCWCLMVDPLFAPARNASSSEDSSVSVATVHGEPHVASDRNSKVSDSDSDVCSDNSDEDSVGNSTDVSVREKNGVDDHDWILLGRASSVAAPQASVTTSNQLEDDNLSINGRVDFVSDSNNTASHMVVRHGDRTSENDDDDDEDDLVMIPDSPTRNSNAAFFDDDVELVECFYGNPSLT
eukprot:g2486.t1